jgi:hypothetical protein
MRRKKSKFLFRYSECLPVRALVLCMVVFSDCGDTLIDLLRFLQHAFTLQSYIANISHFPILAACFSIPLRG